MCALYGEDRGISCYLLPLSRGSTWKPVPYVAEMVWECKGYEAHGLSGQLWNSVGKVVGGEDAQAGEAGMHDDKMRLGVKRRWFLIGLLQCGLEGFWGGRVSISLAHKVSRFGAPVSQTITL